MKYTHVIQEMKEKVKKVELFGVLLVLAVTGLFSIFIFQDYKNELKKLLYILVIVLIIISIILIKLKIKNNIKSNVIKSIFPDHLYTSLTKTEVTYGDAETVGSIRNKYNYEIDYKNIKIINYSVQKLNVSYEAPDYWIYSFDTLYNVMVYYYTYDVDLNEFSQIIHSVLGDAEIKGNIVSVRKEYNSLNEEFELLEEIKINHQKIDNLIGGIIYDKS